MFGNRTKDIMTEFNIRPRFERIVDDYPRAAGFTPAAMAFLTAVAATILGVELLFNTVQPWVIEPGPVLWVYLSVTAILCYKAVSLVLERDLYRALSGLAVWFAFFWVSLGTLGATIFASGERVRLDSMGTAGTPEQAMLVIVTWFAAGLLSLLAYHASTRWISDVQ